MTQNHPISKKNDTTATITATVTNGTFQKHVYNWDNGSNQTSTTNPVFSTVTLRSTLKGNEGLTGEKQIVITGYGIQTEGLTSVTPANVWANFD